MAVCSAAPAARCQTPRFAPGRRGLGAVPAALLLASGLLAPGARAAEPRAGAGDTVVVAAIADGDTLRLRDGRLVRLLQIDAPERATGCYGEAATTLLRRLAPPGTRVRLERDPRLDGRDGYGRLLAYVHAGARNLNLELVRQGAAGPFFFRGRRGRYARTLVRAAGEARRARRGAWGACTAGPRGAVRRLPA